MTKQEAFKVIKLISAAYTNFTIEKDRVELWTEMLSPMPFKQVMENVKKHIRESKFPPTIAEICAEEREVNEFLTQVKLWEDQARTRIQQGGDKHGTA